MRGITRSAMMACFAVAAVACGPLTERDVEEELKRDGLTGIKVAKNDDGFFYMAKRGNDICYGNFTQPKGILRTRTKGGTCQSPESLPAGFSPPGFTTLP